VGEYTTGALLLPDDDETTINVRAEAQ
jgi:hypothetical protein